MTDAPIEPAHQADHQKLLIIDFGSQVTQLIARRLREISVYCEIHPFNTVDDAFLDAFNPRAVILSGGPASVPDEGSPKPPAKVFELGVPVLGICYGQQVMMHMLGGEVVRTQGSAEFGRAYLEPAEDRLELFNGWFQGHREQVWMSHGDHVSRLAPGFAPYATSPGAPFAVVADPARRPSLHSVIRDISDILERQQFPVCAPWVRQSLPVAARGLSGRPRPPDRSFRGR